MSEIRLGMRGSYVAMGIPLAEAAGQKLAQKIETVLRKAGATAVFDKCTKADKGWCACQAHVGSGLIVPSGHLVAFMGHDGEESFTGIRWGVLDVSSEASVQVTVEVLDQLLGTDSELRGTDYRPFRAHLTKYVMPLLRSGD